jgi:hypothetical protein
MPQEFRAIVRETHDDSRRIDVKDMRTGEEKQEEILKGATFMLQSFGPCPWPPQQLAGRVVRVIIED